MNGVLVVDKPAGPTSHDIVARARRALGTRRVGHAGTLDPMATGVLVLAIGEGTKLVPYLTAADKRYVATVRLGSSTTTLDAEGTVDAEAPVPSGLSVADVERAAERFAGGYAQRVPAVSAVKVEGRRLHERVRRGEVVDAPVREVALRALEVRRVSGADVELALECGKGFYVRAFARDLASALGTVGHLVALRRTRSGAFDVRDAVPAAWLEAARLPKQQGGGSPAEATDEAAQAAARARARIREAVRTVADACGALPALTLTARGS
ncbi:MAG: tRNA pseudouridine(55) synthase TruB, partial [Myxococcales bacterium]|nr:tRNA pseudouridine(55) synthase TruB [Myxococcales bacterium]